MLHRDLKQRWKYSDSALENDEYSVSESCKQDFLSPNSLMLDDIMELEKVEQIASAEKRVS